MSGLNWTQDPWNGCWTADGYHIVPKRRVGWTAHAWDGERLDFGSLDEAQSWCEQHDAHVSDYSMAEEEYA